MDIDSLLQRRLLLVTGKGGVGKSTVSMAMALAAHEQGKRVLLCELSARSVSSDFLGVAARPVHAPTRPAAARLPRLWTCHLQPTTALREYFEEHLGAGRLVRIATENRVLSRLWRAAPSVNEMSLLNTVYRHVLAQQEGADQFDLVVVDLPATGHAVSMLGVPGSALTMVKKGALAARMHEVDNLLHDMDKTAVVAVTLAEELPVNETIALTQRLKDRIGLDVAHVVFNNVEPAMFSEGERKLFHQACDKLKDGPAVVLLDSGMRRARRVESQRERMGQLRESLQLDSTVLPTVDSSRGEIVLALSKKLTQPSASEAAA